MKSTGRMELAVFIRLMIRLAEKGRMDMHEVVGDDRLYQEIQADPFRMVPHSIMLRILHHMDRLQGRKWIGNSLTHCSEAEYDLFGIALVSSPTVLEGLKTGCRLMNLNRSQPKLGLAKESGYYRFWMEPGADDLEADSLFNELFAVNTQTFLNQMGVKAPLEVRFRHSPMADKTYYDQVFQSPVRFNQPFNETLISEDTAVSPIPGKDPELNKLALNHLGQMILPVSAGLSSHVSALVREGLDTGETGMARITRRLGIKERTLRHKLKEDGTTFQAILEDAKRAKSAQLLTETDLPLGEVAYLAGFQDPSSFNRAFCRWYGIPPFQYRRRHQQDTKPRN